MDEAVDSKRGMESSLAVGRPYRNNSSTNSPMAAES